RVWGAERAVLGNEEAGAEAHREAAARALLRARIRVLLTELLEEALHRRAGLELEGEVLVVEGRGLGATVRLDAHAHHRRVHLLDEIGKARQLHALDLDGCGKGESGGGEIERTTRQRATKDQRQSGAGEGERAEGTLARVGIL